jgi:hypothetical protein
MSLYNYTEDVTHLFIMFQIRHPSTSHYSIWIQTVCSCGIRLGLAFFYDLGPKTKLLSNSPEVFSKPEKIVWTLVASEPSVLGVGRILAVDNYYTSINLFYELLKCKTDPIGTVRKNRRGLPHSVLKHSWNKSEKGMKFGRKVARRRVKKFYKNIFFHLFDTTHTSISKKT